MFALTPLRHPLLAALAILALATTLATTTPAAAGPITTFHTGTFTRDDDVQFFQLHLNAASHVTLVSYSYAGGTNAAGQAIPRGGFDPVLALFDLAGTLLAQNDDGGANVPADAITGATHDSFLALNLAAGDYTIAILQFDNEAIGPTLASGFTRPGEAAFTTTFGCPDAQPSFNDLSGLIGCGRTNAFAFDAITNTPEPASAALLGIGLLALTLRRRT